MVSCKYIAIFFGVGQNGFLLITPPQMMGFSSIASSFIWVCGSQLILTSILMVSHPPPSAPLLDRGCHPSFLPDLAVHQLFLWLPAEALAFWRANPGHLLCISLRHFDSPVNCHSFNNQAMNFTPVPVAVEKHDHQTVTRVK